MLYNFFKGYAHAFSNPRFESDIAMAADLALRFPWWLRMEPPWESEPILNPGSVTAAL